MALNKTIYGNIAGKNLTMSVQASTKCPFTLMVLESVKLLCCQQLASGWIVTSERTDSRHAAVP